MKFQYMLNQDDLKEYYQEALKNDDQVIKFRWRMRLFVPVTILIILAIARPALPWILLFIGIAVGWILLSEFVFYPKYEKTIIADYMSPDKMKLKSMKVELTEESTKVDGQVMKVVDYAVFPTLLVIIFEGGKNTIIPNRVLDNDIQKLNEATALLNTQLGLLAKTNKNEKEPS